MPDSRKGHIGYVAAQHLRVGIVGTGLVAGVGAGVVVGAGVGAGVGARVGAGVGA